MEITCSILKALNLVNQMNGSFANPEPWLAKIVNVYVDSRIAKVLYYHKTGEEEDSTGMQTAIYRPEKNPCLNVDRVYSYSQGDNTIHC